MAQFTGRLQGPSLAPSAVAIEIEDGRIRVAAGSTQIGSWPLDGIKAERTSIYRFSLDIAGDNFDFFPDDPSAFSDAVGAVIDLASNKGRFGLRAFIRDASDA